MSRITRFRGKRLDNGEWVYGSLIQYSRPETTPDIYDPETSQYFAVDRKTVGEFTGLHDKNGKEVFEGDILASSMIDNQEVVFLNGSFDTRTLPDGDDWERLCTTLLNCPDCEVIGDIHFNPELLEAKS